jgi:NADPH:quinone reductase-like Zn-dependent oxidoreductase
MSERVLKGERLRVQAQAAGIDSLVLDLDTQAAPSIGPGEILVRVEAAGVNPSDVKAALGFMPQAVFPRTPGRDFAGEIVDGPTSLIGQKVWGSGGDIGITRDGSHGRYLRLPQEAAIPVPQGMDLLSAGALGVPFVTACEGFARVGGVQRGQTVAVLGANGKVGQAAVQIASRAGARVIAVQRSERLEGFASGPVDVVNASAVDATAAVLDLTQGRGADVVFNTVNKAYWTLGNAVMAKYASQIFIIGTKGDTVPFDVFRFYRNVHTFVGIDTLVLGCVTASELLNGLRTGFEDGTLRPYPVAAADVYTLQNAMDAYRAVLAGAPSRVVLTP